MRSSIGDEVAHAEARKNGALRAGKRWRFEAIYYHTRPQLAEETCQLCRRGH